MIVADNNINYYEQLIKGELTERRGKQLIYSILNISEKKYLY